MIDNTHNFFNEYHRETKPDYIPYIKAKFLIESIWLYLTSGPEWQRNISSIAKLVRMCNMFSDTDNPLDKLMDHPGQTDRLAAATKQYRNFKSSIGSVEQEKDVIAICLDICNHWKIRLGHDPLMDEFGQDYFDNLIKKDKQ